MKIRNDGKAPIFIMLSDETKNMPLVATPEIGMMIRPKETIHLEASAISVCAGDPPNDNDE